MTNDIRIRKEIDPHFFLNSFTTLAHLIHADMDKAYLFNNKLAQVYKYFLIHKDHTTVLLQDELEFIENYFFLLRVRHDEKVALSIEGSDLTKKARIIPFALQFLVDYAIRYNKFSETKPLQLLIKTTQERIEIINKDSKRIDVKNAVENTFADLSERYMDCCKQEVLIEQKGKEFIVKLPIIHSDKS